LTYACSRTAGEQHLDARLKALSNRLLVEADQLGFPVELLTEPTEKATQTDWRQRDAQMLIEVLAQVEQQWTRPTGLRRWVQGVAVFLANWLPLLALFGILVLKLWQYTMQGLSPALGDILLPVFVVVIVLVLLHLLITLVLPMRWPAMRGEFHRHLEGRLLDELQKVYGAIPDEVAGALRRDRKAMENLSAQAGEVATWLDQREQAAHVAGLYGR
jgi:hypothetical protein